MKLVVPIKPKTMEEAQAFDLSKFEGADMIEWRADFLPLQDILLVAPVIFEKFAGFEIIFTLRTLPQGGHLDISPEDYVALLKEIQTLYQPDYIDFEYYPYRTVFEQMLNFPNLVLSYYNFEQMPDNIMEIYSELTALAPRVVKIAVMPKTPQEVLDLMNFTRGFKTLNPSQDYVTIAMGGLGQVTRLFGDLFGSSWSMVKTDVALAPGQLTLAESQLILDILERNR